MSPWDKVVSMRRKTDVPDWIVVAFVAHETSKSLETPQPDCSIFRAWQQVISEGIGEAKLLPLHHLQLRHFVSVIKKTMMKMSTCLDWNWHRTLGHCVRGGSLTRWPSSRPWSSPARHPTPCQSDLSLRAEEEGVGVGGALNWCERNSDSDICCVAVTLAVPAADLTLRSFFGVTLHTLTVESAKPPAIRLESSVTSTPVRPCRDRGVDCLSTFK